MPPRADAGALTLQQQAFRPRRLIEALADTLSARARDQRPHRRSDGRRRLARNAGRRPGAAARGDREPDRQRGEIHRARAMSARRARDASRARKNQSSSARHRQRHRTDARRDQAAVPPVHPGQRGHRAALRRRRPRACGGQIACQADGRRPHRHQHARPRLDVSSRDRCCRSRPPADSRATSARATDKDAGAPARGSVRRGQSLRPRHPQHHPHRARPSRRLRRLAARRRSRRSSAATTWC